MFGHYEVKIKSLFYVFNYNNITHLKLNAYVPSPTFILIVYVASFIWFLLL